MVYAAHKCCLLFIALGVAAPLAAGDLPSDFVPLADPARLQKIKDDCLRVSEGLRNSPATPDQSEGLHMTYECLLSAAVDEFRTHIATEFFTTEEFETRLRRLTDEDAQFIIDINIKHERDFPPGTMWGPIAQGTRVQKAEEYLDEIWAYYRNNCFPIHC